MAHIVIDARIINSSTGRYVERLLTYLQSIEDEHRYTVLVPSKDLDFWNPTDERFTVMAADYDNYSFNEQFGYWRFLKKLTPDLVHFCMPQQPVLYRGKTVTTFHDLTLLKTYNSDKNWFSYRVKQFIGRFVFTRVAHKSSAIIVPTDFTGAEVQRYLHVSDKKITRTYEAADVTVGRTRSYELPFKQFLLYVGQQPDFKNIRALGDAHQKLLARHPDLGLVLVGRKKADAKSNEAYFAKKGYRNIVFTDFVEDEQRDWLYQHCAAYVFPSLMEGFGLPGLEAMACGAPVVSSNTTCLPEVYGDAAVYFNPHKPDSIARAIDSVISDKALRERLVALGYIQVSKYSWQRMAVKTHDVYTRVLS
jgi:glycosyltransferase involved in cell wall biosynthesis